MRTLLVAVLLITGCIPTTAVIDGRPVPRPTLGYTDHRYFGIRHRRAYPAPVGPSDGVWSYAGRVDGTVCGVDVRLDGDFYGRQMQVTGFISSVRNTRSMRPLILTVADRQGVRHIMGGGADLELTPTSLRGSITMRSHYRKFFLQAEGDDELVGEIESFGMRFPFVVRGRRALWAMPAIDQAALLPLMLTCNAFVAGARFEAPIAGVDFGAP
jgi:hypothetical protein